jgi:hypothetical protein
VFGTAPRQNGSIKFTPKFNCEFAINKDPQELRAMLNADAFTPWTANQSHTYETPLLWQHVVFYAVRLGSTTVVFKWYWDGTKFTLTAMTKEYFIANADTFVNDPEPQIPLWPDIGDTPVVKYLNITTTSGSASTDSMLISKMDDEAWVTGHSALSGTHYLQYATGTIDVMYGNLITGTYTPVLWQGSAVIPVGEGALAVLQTRDSPRQKVYMAVGPDPTEPETFWKIFCFNDTWLKAHTADDLKAEFYVPSTGLPGFTSTPAVFYLDSTIENDRVSSGVLDFFREDPNLSIYLEGSMAMTGKLISVSSTLIGDGISNAVSSPTFNIELVTQVITGSVSNLGSGRIVAVRMDGLYGYLLYNRDPAQPWRRMKIVCVNADWVNSHTDAEAQALFAVENEVSYASMGQFGTYASRYSTINSAPGSSDQADYVDLGPFRMTMNAPSYPSGTMTVASRDGANFFARAAVTSEEGRLQNPSTKTKLSSDWTYVNSITATAQEYAGGGNSTALVEVRRFSTGDIYTIAGTRISSNSNFPRTETGVYYYPGVQ